MDESIYEIVSLALRYWFLLVAAVIVLRSYMWLFKDRREKHRRLRQLPDAGMIGEMVVTRGNNMLEEGTTLPVPWEGDLGCKRSCDICIPNEDGGRAVAKRHMDFSFVNGKGLFVFPEKHCQCVVDGVMVKFRNRAKVVMHHGSTLQVGDVENGDYVEMRLRLFVGLSTAASAQIQSLPEENMHPQVQPLPQYPDEGMYGDAEYSPYANQAGSVYYDEENMQGYQLQQYVQPYIGDDFSNVQQPWGESSTEIPQWQDMPEYNPEEIAEYSFPQQEADPQITARRRITRRERRQQLEEKDDQSREEN